MGSRFKRPCLGVEPPPPPLPTTTRHATTSATRHRPPPPSPGLYAVAIPAQVGFRKPNDSRLRYCSSSLAKMIEGRRDGVGLECGVLKLARMAHSPNPAPLIVSPVRRSK